MVQNCTATVQYVNCQVKISFLLKHQKFSNPYGTFCINKASKCGNCPIFSNCDTDDTYSILFHQMKKEKNPSVNFN